ncbi:energy-coupling factor transporter transmembrane component T family protein [Lyngbya confervoides]|uniref:Energy-coupling factor transporter transmembrane protein EcfT n=1 Tax=Lyngbya confervoides BDU141951 TaxID=1574623 RepID=A0ABD4T1X3_9CYAN|nr:energy-coupling factor transporter transmembrane protein EcfT [Lyngbya confervoides]MCM1982761.1 energy-coupling factor transporter transmembrane protein EcfT [Lyngbya confervoides BDU141951]
MDLLRSLPLGLYLEAPVTWLHQLDSRVKLAWLMTFLVSPIWANSLWRFLLVGLLIVFTLTALIPLRVWRQQMGWLLALCLVVLLVTAVMPDGYNLQYAPRLPQDELRFQDHPPAAPQPEPWYQFLRFWDAPQDPDRANRSPDRVSLDKFQPYHYVLWNWGPFTVTRKSVQLAVRISTWLFTLIYGTNLFLLTTPPEAIAATLQILLNPLRQLNLPVVEVGLTLTLSLRFIPLVLEEVQNLIRSVRTRAIRWRKVGVKGTIQLVLLLIDRLVENLFLRAEQIASAMTVRGFTHPNQHQVLWHAFQLRRVDWFAIGLLVVLWGVRFWQGQAD